VLGIARSHNGAVALLKDGAVAAAIQAERLTRRKRQPLFLRDDRELVSGCVRYCLEAAGIGYSDLAAAAICTAWKVEPLAAERLAALIGGPWPGARPILHVPHHLAHAEYAVHYGPPAAAGLALVVDGSGAWEADRASFSIETPLRPDALCFADPAGKEVISAFVFDGAGFQVLYRQSPAADPRLRFDENIPELDSIGKYWEWASQYCHGSRNHAGKVMGLAAHGDPATYAGVGALTMTREGRVHVDYGKLRAVFLEPNVVRTDVSLRRHYADVAAMVQGDTIAVLLGLLERLQARARTRTLYFSGGVALNVVANERIVRSGLFDAVHLNGSCEDNGTAIGAAVAAHHALTGDRRPELVTDYYGRAYGAAEVHAAVAESGIAYRVLDDDGLVREAGAALASGRIIGWFQGRSEFGPRALGNRSILANPLDPDTKPLLDLLMKQRERYRPYAPIVPEEAAARYFDLAGSSPVMMREAYVRGGPPLPAITHADGSARVQTVAQRDNPLLHALMWRFAALTGVPVLLNTSFNGPGEPIVESPDDALRFFQRGFLDALYLGRIAIDRL